VGITLAEIEMRLELLSIELKELSKIIQEIDARAQELQGGDV
jgi:chaperonin cofactor prefoldin